MQKSSNNGLELSIVILSYNTRELLVNCLSSIREVINEVSCELVVVDNASSDGSVEAIQKLKIRDHIYKSKLKIVVNDKNLGFAAGNNKARSEVRGDYVLFLNSDTEVPKGTLRE